MDAEHITPAYDIEGIEAFYRRVAAGYRNPHEASVVAALSAAVSRWRPDLRTVLDLACGSGEVTAAISELDPSATVSGVDPYTAEAYAERTGQTAEEVDFAAIAAGCFEERAYSLIVCSYAMHLCDVSRLPALCLALSRIAPAMLILSPHKRPMIQAGWGWTAAEELIVERVHARWHRSVYFSHTNE